MLVLQDLEKKREKRKQHMAEMAKRNVELDALKVPNYVDDSLSFSERYRKKFYDKQKELKSKGYGFSTKHVSEVLTSAKIAIDKASHAQHPLKEEKEVDHSKVHAHHFQNHHQDHITEEAPLYQTSSSEESYSEDDSFYAPPTDSDFGEIESSSYDTNSFESNSRIKVNITPSGSISSLLPPLPPSPTSNNFDEKTKLPDGENRIEKINIEKLSLSKHATMARSALDKLNMAAIEDIDVSELDLTPESPVLRAAEHTRSVTEDAKVMEQFDPWDESLREPKDDDNDDSFEEVEIIEKVENLFDVPQEETEKIPLLELATTNPIEEKTSKEGEEKGIQKTIGNRIDLHMDEKSQIEKLRHQTVTQKALREESSILERKERIVHMEYVIVQTELQLSRLAAEANLRDVNEPVERRLEREYKINLHKSKLASQRLLLGQQHEIAALEAQIRDQQNQERNGNGNSNSNSNVNCNAGKASANHNNSTKSLNHLNATSYVSFIKKQLAMEGLMSDKTFLGEGIGVSKPDDLLKEEYNLTGPSVDISLFDCYADEFNMDDELEEKDPFGLSR
eukprot:g561.t1